MPLFSDLGVDTRVSVTWTLTLVDTLTFRFLLAFCNPDTTCNGQGICGLDGICQCSDGQKGVDCSGKLINVTKNNYVNFLNDTTLIIILFLFVGCPGNKIPDSNNPNQCICPENQVQDSNIIDMCTCMNGEVPELTRDCGNFNQNAPLIA